MTGNTYKGGNAETLLLNPYESKEYATMRQWVQLGHRVKESENKKYTRLKFFKPETNAQGQTENKMTYFNVFNREQLES